MLKLINGIWVDCWPADSWFRVKCSTDFLFFCSVYLFSFDICMISKKRVFFMCFTGNCTFITRLLFFVMDNFFDAFKSPVFGQRCALLFIKGNRMSSKTWMVINEKTSNSFYPCTAYFKVG